MSGSDTYHQQAAHYVDEAARLRAENAIPEARVALRHAVLLYAAADEDLLPESGLPAWSRARADACQSYGDCLQEIGEYPEAAQVYQEAADLYGRLGGPEAERDAHECARKVLLSVEALRARPHERLYLLIASYERRQRQFALEPGQEREQAQCCRHIADIFRRRGRAQEALARYREALALFGQAPPDRELLLACADCHREIAVLALGLHDLQAAARHCREAIGLYSAHETAQYGRQPLQAFCVRVLEEIERGLGQNGGSGGALAGQ